MNGGLTSMAGGLGRASIALAGLTALAGGLTALAMAFSGASDEAAGMTARLNLAYNSATGLAQANQQVHDIANQTRSSLSATTDLYTKMAMNADMLKLSQAQVGVATRTFAMSLKVAGASAQESESSILQLGQALGSGVLQGDEFKSLAENNQLFMKMLAVSMDVPLGKLKALGSEGKITGEQITKALTDPKMIAEIEKMFGKIPVTFGDVRVAIGNMLVDMATAFKTGLGIDDSLAVILAKVQDFAKTSAPTIQKFGAAFRDVITGIAPVVSTVFGAIGPVLGAVASNMDNLVRAAIGLGGAFLVFKGAGVVGSLAGVLGQVVALEKAMGATGTASALMSAGMKLAQGSVNGLTAAMLANPITFIAVALTAVIGLLYQFSDKIGIGTGHVATLADVGAVVFDKIGGFFSSLGSTASNVLKSIGKFFDWAFGGIWKMVAPIFSNFEFSFAGIARFGARALDLLVSHFDGGFNVIKTLWSMLPQTMGAIATSTANSVIGGIEWMINTTISGINKLISLANNIPGINFGQFSDVSLSRFEGPEMPDFSKVLDAYTSKRSHTFENMVESVFSEADARHRANAVKPNDSPSGNIKPDTGKSADKDKDKAKSDLENILKQTREFWSGLEQATKLAGMLPLDAERYNKELELRKILGGGELKDTIQLNDKQKEGIANALRATHLAENLTSMRAETLAQENLGIVNSLRKTGLAGNELKIEDALTERRVKALGDGLKLTDLASAAWKIEEERLRVVLRTNLGYDDQRAKLEAIRKTGQDLIGGLSDRANPRRTLQEQYDKDRAAIVAASAMKPDDFAGTDAEWRKRVGEALGQLHRDYVQDQRDANREFFRSFSDSIYNLAGLFEGKLGEALDAISGIFDQVTSFVNPESSLGKLFRPGSPLMDGLKKFSAGAEMGGQIANLAQAVGIKGFNQTGAQIGGGIGGMLGPIGSIVGSVLGGVVGGLFSKPKSSNAGFTTDAQGNVTVGSVSGSNSTLKGAASGAAGSVIEGLQKIATQIGGQLTGTPNLSIGTWDGKWRVNDFATTKALHSNNFSSSTLHNFGDDEAAAVAYAISKALKDGVITGLATWAGNALKKLDSDSAIAAIQTWAGYMSDMESIVNPVGSAIKSFLDPFDALRKTMVEMGATTSELTKLDEYRKLKLDAIMKEQLSTLTDFRKSLSGNGSGVTSLSRLMASMAQFETFKSDIAAGKTIDQSAFTSLGGEIMNLAGSLYGTSTSAFQSIRAMLMQATDGAIENVQAIAGDATVVALQQQTEMLAQQINAQVVANGYLQQIAEATQNNSNGSNDRSNALAVNGRYVAEYV